MILAVYQEHINETVLPNLAKAVNFFGRLFFDGKDYPIKEIYEGPIASAVDPAHPMALIRRS